MALFENKWRLCTCTVQIKDHMILYQGREFPLKDLTITNDDTLVCPFGIFGCNSYKVDEKGNIKEV